MYKYIYENPSRSKEKTKAKKQKKINILKVNKEF